MRLKFPAILLAPIIAVSTASAAVVVEKRSRPLPFSEVFECEGMHSFVFRGPKGTERKPILVRPREYWTAREAGLCSFILRDPGGHVCSRLVTPEVFARYRIGDDFNDCAPGPSDRIQTDDSKSMQPVVHRRKRTSQMRKRKHASHRVAKAKHQRKHRPQRIAAR